MTNFEAHGLFCVRPDGGHSLLHPDCDAEIAPAFCTSLASLSGMLNDANTQNDLDEAVKHGLNLLGADIVTQEQLDAEVRKIFAEVAEWGKRTELELN